MKKLIYVCTFLSFQISYSLLCETLINDGLILKKNVSIITSTIIIENGFFNLNESKTTFSILNEKENAIEEKTKSLKGEDIVIQKYTYGTCDKPLMIVTLAQRGEKFDTVQIENKEYNQNCQLLTFKIRDSSGNSCSINYTYNENGKMSSQIFKDEYGVISSFTLYSYPNENTIDIKSFYSDSSFMYHAKETVNSKGKRVRIISLDKDGNIFKQYGTEKIDYIYIGDKISEENHFNTDGLLWIKIRDYYNSDSELEMSSVKQITEGQEKQIIYYYKYFKK